MTGMAVSPAECKDVKCLLHMLGGKAIVRKASATYSPPAGKADVRRDLAPLQGDECRTDEEP